ncbi:MAG TPA: DegT/DnrJ/EryC1/StrS family aminotransferase [Candidatus Binatia bacterium]
MSTSPPIRASLPTSTSRPAWLDLAADFRAVEVDARRRIDGVLARQQFVLGPETAELEASLGARLGAKCAVAVSSGSDALYLALVALGIGAGDAVVLPAFTFFATAGAVWRAGAVPVFCDIDRKSFNAGAAEFRTAIARHFEGPATQLRHRASGARLAALLPVHLYGYSAPIGEIVTLAREHGVAVIEDAAQAIDCRHGGASVGCFGEIGCFSFYPTKNLGGPGDGGLVVARDENLGARITGLRSHGATSTSYQHDEVGINARMGELVAAVLNAKLPHLAGWTARRREIASLYARLLAPGQRHGLVAPALPAGVESHVWHQFTVRIDDPRGSGRRDRVAAILAERAVPTRVFYPQPLHLQPCFATLGGKPGDLPEAECAAGEVLCLPIHPSLSDEAVAVVAKSLEAAVASA